MNENTTDYYQPLESMNSTFIPHNISADTLISAGIYDKIPALTMNK